MLNLTRLDSTLKTVLPGFRYHLHESLPSTSAFLKDCAVNDSTNAVCVANLQTEGYGQQSRRWLSNSESLTFSMLLNFSLPIHQIHGLSLLTAWAVVDILSEMSDVEPRIKWPNDIYVQACKAGGLLVECVSHNEESCRLVIGIGLNGSSFTEVKDTYTDHESLIAGLDLNEEVSETLIVELSRRLLHLSQFIRPDTLKMMLPKIEKYDFFRPNQPVIVYDSDQVLSGLYQGLTSQGHVLVEIDGLLVTYHSGQTSIRASKY